MSPTELLLNRSGHHHKTRRSSTGSGSTIATAGVRSSARRAHRTAEAKADALDDSDALTIDTANTITTSGTLRGAADRGGSSVSGAHGLGSNSGTDNGTDHSRSRRAVSS
jgi:hypothetical protein